MAKSPSAAIAEDDSKQDANTDVPFETFESISEAKVSQWVKAFKIFGQFCDILEGSIEIDRNNCLHSGKNYRS